VLTTDDISLYKDEQSYRESQKPQEKMLAKGLRPKLVDEIQNSRQNCFGLAWDHSKTAWVLSANSDQERKQWLSAVRGVNLVHPSRPTNTPASFGSKSPPKQSTDFSAIPAVKRKPREEMTDEEKFLDDIDLEREEENNKLDTLGDLVDGLRDMAQNMNAGLQSHQQLIQQVGVKLDENSVQLKQENTKLQKLVK